MNDLLPMHTSHWQQVEDLYRDHFLRAGLGEIRTPLIESTDLFSRGIGESTDVVGKEMYTFADRGNRSCTLRPEGTASVVRSVLQHGLLSNGPQRYWYAGPMFRYERPQAGRQRQFHQLGVEFFGLPTSRDDAELISIAWDLLKDFGLKGLKLELNSLGSFEDRQRYRNQITSWLEKRFDLLDQDSQDRLYKNPLRILDTKNPETQNLLNEAPSFNDSLSDSSQSRFQDLQKMLNTLGIPYELNNRLVRGLDYYCHTAFEITSDQLGAQATICGGGRYDGLVEQLGGPPTPSIGWAIGMERLMILMEDKKLQKFCPDVYFVNLGKEAELNALSLTRKLRSAKLKVILDSSGSSFSKQFKRANRSNAKWALILGDNEFASEEVRIKSLQSLDKETKEIKVKQSHLSEIVSILVS